MASTAAPESKHRIKVRILVVLASILAFLAIFTGWVDRQALDTDHWVDTSGRLLEDEVISDAMANYTVDQLYANVDVPALLKKRLPKNLQPVASPAAAGIRALSTRAAERAFQSPRVLTLWKQANRVAHTQLVAILEGKSETVSSQGGKVVLDLRPIVLQLADRLGLKKQVTHAIDQGEASGRVKPGFSQLEIADSKQLDTAQTVTKILKGLAWLFSLGSLVLFGVAVYLAAGRRWVVVLGYGLGLIAAGLAAIAVRSAAKGLVIDSLAKTEEARAPAEHAWDISTSLLHSIASSVIIFGVLFVIAAFLASPVNLAVSIRQALAPTLRERRGIVWSVFAAVALLAVIIWPPDGTRSLVLTLVLIALAGIGLEALARETQREFPGAKRGDWMLAMRERTRRAGTEAGRRIGSAMRGLTDEEKHPEDAKLERLERLGELKEKGVLTATEFRDQKKKILSG
ncbi:MAG TPA: SHOCT domain-containing protein [Solirubrobacterales bacterium]